MAKKDKLRIVVLQQQPLTEIAPCCGNLSMAIATCAFEFREKLQMVNWKICTNCGY